MQWSMSLTRKSPTVRLYSHILRFMQTQAPRWIWRRLPSRAHAGAAVIVPQRTLVWLPTSRSANRDAEPVVCAEHWLIDNANVFNNGEPTLKVVPLPSSLSTNM